MIMFITVTNEFKHKKQKEKGLTITFVKPLVLVREITSYLSLFTYYFQKFRYQEGDAEGCVFRDIENVTIDHGLPSKDTDMPEPVIDDKYTVAQLYRFVKGGKTR